MDNLLEQIRREVLSGLFATSFANNWEVRRSFFRKNLKTQLRKNDVIALGSLLSEAFALSGKNDRSQGGVSSAGVVWESLIVWYLNLCLLGTNSVAVRGAPLCPSPIKDALSVCFENTILRSEPDVLVLSSNALMQASAVSNKSKMLKAASDLLEDNFKELGVVNFQCKTNWNDNAQIPMLWNMLYNQAKKGALIPNGFSIGRNGYALKNLGFFGYGFVTVPTGKRGTNPYKPQSLCVMRVRTMSAGNYWGCPTVSGVSLSLAEFFNVFNRDAKVFPNVAEVGARSAELLKHQQDSRMIVPFRL